MPGPGRTVLPSRIIKESIWTSPNLNQLSVAAERHFYRILPLPDDFGCFEATPDVVRGRCYPLKESVRSRDVEAWQSELELRRLIVRWMTGGRQYAIIPKWNKHQRIRSTHQRKTPEPPPEIIAKCQEIESIDGNNQQLTTGVDE